LGNKTKFNEDKKKVFIEFDIFIYVKKDRVDIHKTSEGKLVIFFVALRFLYDKIIHRKYFNLGFLQ